MKDPRRAAVRYCLFEFFGLAAKDQLLPIELLVEKEDEEVDVYFSSVK